MSSGKLTRHGLRLSFWGSMDQGEPPAIAVPATPGFILEIGTLIYSQFDNGGDSLTLELFIAEDLFFRWQGNATAERSTNIYFQPTFQSPELTSDLMWQAGDSTVPGGATVSFTGVLVPITAFANLNP